MSVRPHVAVCECVRAALLLLLELLPLLLRCAAARHPLLLALGLSHFEAKGPGQELTPAQQAHLQQQQHHSRTGQAVILLVPQERDVCVVT